MIITETHIAEYNDDNPLHKGILIEPETESDCKLIRVILKLLEQDD